MCTLSYVGDHAQKWIPQEHPWVHPFIQPYVYPRQEWEQPVGPTKAEFDALAAEVRELKKLLIAAKKYDEEHGEPDCEIDEKVELLKKIAQLVDVDLDEVFGVGSA